MRKALFFPFMLLLFCGLALPAFAATSDMDGSSVLSTILVAVIVGVLIGIATVIAVLLHYRKKKHGESYPLNRYADLYLTESHDRFVGSFVTRVRIQTNSSNQRRRS